MEKSRLQPWLLAAIFLFCLAALISYITLIFAIPRNDFYAYYRAAERFLAGISPYQNEVDLPFKYPPVTVLYFLPFTLVSHPTARWIYLMLHYAMILAFPVVCYRIAAKDSGARLDGFLSTTVLVGILLGFTASLRFLEIEFRAGQVGIWLGLLVFLGADILCRGDWKIERRIALGVGVLTLGAIFKFHTLLVFFLFLRRQPWRDVAVALAVVAVIVFLPDPRMWADWIHQVANTTPYAPLEKGQYVAQGIYGFAAHYLDMTSASMRPMILILPYLAVSALFLPRFRMRDLPESPLAFLAALCSLMLLGVLASPLPWTHTYSVLFGIVMASWLCAEGWERWVLVAIVLFLGLTPSGLIGRGVAIWMEIRQSVFFACTALWALLVWQAHRRFLAARFFSGSALFAKSHSTSAAISSVSLRQ